MTVIKRMKSLLFILEIQANDLIVEHFLEKEVDCTIVWCCDQTLWVDVEEQEEYDG